MKLSTLNSRLITAATAAFAAFAAVAADISDVIVRQQWPWSTDIKVEFKLTNVTTPVTVNVEASEGNTPLDSTNLRNAITGDLWGLTEGGVYSFMIDPKVAFGEERAAIPNFKVRLSLTDAPANADEILYKIVDLDPPYAVTTVRRRDFYNGKYSDYVTSFSDIYSTFQTSLEDVLIWRGVTNDIYKTDKMVFRRIPAAGKTFNLQNDASKQVTFTKDFYIGVFEVTQSQQAKFYTRKSWETNALYAAKRPATQLSIITLRGSGTWPDNKTHTDCQNYDCLAGNMQKATGLRVDLPTEAMWDYACRAGTTSTLYGGTSDDMTSSLHAKLCRARYRNRPDINYGNDASTRNSDLSDCTAAVGTYLPNAFGLYDMLGNALELCLDRWSDSPPGGTDPVGTTSTAATEKNYCVGRGGSANTAWGDVYDGARTKKMRDFASTYVDNGGRLCIWLGDNDDGEL